MDTLPTLSALAIGALLMLGCGDDSPSDGSGGMASGGASNGGAASGGSGGAMTCTSTRGTLAGTIYLFAAPPSPDATTEPGSLVALTAVGTMDPILAMAEDNGEYEVELEAGDWIVGGQDAEAGCFVDQAAVVTISPCETTQHDVVLDVCIGSGTGGSGAGGANN